MQCGDAQAARSPSARQRSCVASPPPLGRPDSCLPPPSALFCMVTGVRPRRRVPGHAHPTWPGTAEARGMPHRAELAQHMLLPVARPALLAARTWAWRGRCLPAAGPALLRVAHAARAATNAPRICCCSCSRAVGQLQRAALLRQRRCQRSHDRHCSLGAQRREWHDLPGTRRCPGAASPTHPGLPAPVVSWACAGAGAMGCTQSCHMCPLLGLRSMRRSAACAKVGGEWQRCTQRRRSPVHCEFVGLQTNSKNTDGTPRSCCSAARNPPNRSVSSESASVWAMGGHSQTHEGGA
mmetsp:Transcript_23680/g.60807  ORF Transcript_23680/g.60807 Transcript_23680/m.60807 type:complete len:295 (-) Transcript_23680:764-1648(-)